MIDLKEKRVLLTGSDGFIGRAILAKLQGMGAKSVRVPHAKYELTEWKHVFNLFAEWQPDVVIHAAGYNGGIKFNQDHPADIFYRNTVMGLNVLRACQRFSVEKVVSLVASCGYSPERVVKDLDAPYFEREYLWCEPHETVECHGYAKRNLHLASQFYSRQFKLNAICACVTTVYGPGDSFDPDRTKVMGAIIKKIVDAADSGAEEVVLWGSGNPRRQFIYVDDAAALLLLVAQSYDDPEEIINVACDSDISIKEVADLVAAAADFKGKIKWDASMPDGQRQKQLDYLKLGGLDWPKGFMLPLTPLADGIRKTVEYYRNPKGKVS